MTIPRATFDELGSSIFTVMNVKPFLLATVLAVSSSVWAQEPMAPEPPGNQPPPPREGGRGKDRKGPGFLEKLPPEVRERFKEAREKALQDPKIQELRAASDKANRDFFEAMRLKMQEIDPGLAEIIKKNVDQEKRGPEGRGGGKQKGMQNLTDAEREQLMAARDKAKDAPAVKAARDKREAATTPADRQAAGEELHKAMNDAILKTDPALAPVLKKLGNTPPPPPVEPPGPGDEMGPPPSP